MIVFISRQVSYQYLFNFNFNLIVTQVGGVGMGAYLSLIGGRKGVEVGMGAYSRLGANSRLGAYSNKYGMAHRILHFLHFLK